MTAREPLIARRTSVAPTEPVPDDAATWRKRLLGLALAAGLSVLVMFLLWEAVERSVPADAAVLSRLHYVRGVSTSLVTAAIVGLISYRQHRERMAILEDVVARRTTELETARSLLQLVFDATPASLMVLDRDFQIVEANRAAERLHGLPLSAKTCHLTLVGRDQPCESCPAVETFESRVPTILTGEHADPRTGEILAVESHHLQLANGDSFVLLVERSVTEQKKLQARMVHQEKMAAFGLLAAGVAHDMGNPLSSIVAQLQLVDDDELTDDVRAMVATVRQESERLRRILRELVDFARRRRDEASLVSVQAVVGDALRLLRHDRRMRDVKTREEYDSETPPVSMIEDHLMQVVFNLLLNAVDAMPVGGDLRIEVRPAGDRVVLRVHDSGHGMEKSVLDRSFEPLFTTKEPGQGTGLGLSICKDILVAAGGTIELHSAPGQGATAVVVLPAATGDEPPAPPATSTASALAAGTKAG